MKNRNIFDKLVMSGGWFSDKETGKTHLSPRPSLPALYSHKGTYYLRANVGGKRYRVSLQTMVFWEAWKRMVEWFVQHNTA